jgi:hypothetical protein
MRLFEQSPDPNCLRPARHSEKRFAYYQACSLVKIGRVRSFLEELFEAYPDCEHKKSLAQSMRASEDGFDSGFFEMLLYSLFVRLGCAVEPEPMLGELGPSRPDFLVRLPSQREVYVEAVVANGVSEARRQRNSLLNVFYDYVNDHLASPRFFWRIEVESSSTQAPRARQVVATLQRHAQTLNWDSLVQAKDMKPSDCNRLLDAHGIKVETNGWEFEFTPIPKKPEAFEKNGRPLGWFPMEGGMSITKEQLRDQISKKRKQHGLLDRPLVIAINAVQTDVDDEDFHGAIYGSEVMQVSISKDGHPLSSVMSRAKDGAWLDASGPKHEHIPYILCSKHISPSNLDTPIRICPNPYNVVEDELVIPGLPRFEVGNGLLEPIKGATPGSVFELPLGWPSQEDYEVRAQKQKKMEEEFQKAWENHVG